MFWTSSLCTLKVLFIADNTILNYPLTSLILSVVYCQFYKATLAHTKREARDYLVIVSTLACNKEDCSWVLQSEERIKEASRNSTIWWKECLL